MKVTIPPIETELRVVQRGLRRLQVLAPSGDEFSKKELGKLAKRLSTLERKVQALKKQHV